MGASIKTCILSARTHLVVRVAAQPHGLLLVVLQLYEVNELEVLPGRLHGDEIAGALGAHACRCGPREFTGKVGPLCVVRVEAES